MQTVMIFFVIGSISYLVGSFPTAFLFGKIFQGIDIREHGSGNVGTTNAFRILGKKLGTCVFIIDLLKGFFPVLLALKCSMTSEYIVIFSAMMSVVGHNWTCFLRFKGGKGVATSAGALLGLTLAFPALRFGVLLCILLWGGVLLLTGYISVSSIIAAIFLPILMLIFNASFSVVLLSLIFSLFILLKHHSNIQRLLQGQEPKVPLFFHKK